MATKADATRWLEKNVGQQIWTDQVWKDSGVVWVPGRRTLQKFGKTGFQFDNGSHVKITKDHTILEVTYDKLVMRWNDEEGNEIHETTYTVLKRIDC